MRVGNYAEEIKKILSTEVLAPQVSEGISEAILGVRNQVSQYLISLNEWNTIASHTINTPYIQDMDVKPEVRRYIAAKEAIRLQPQIQELLKQGYVIIDLIREFFTGQHITYQIGVEYYGKLYEGQLSMEQIMSLAQVQPDWKGNVNSLVKLRLSGLSKGNLKDMLEEVENLKDSTHSTLYSSIRAYASSTQKHNKGNLYEVYRILKGRYGSNEIPPASWSAEEFEEIYLSVVRNTASFVKGGDILTEQVKFFGTSVPSLAALGTIRNTLEAFMAITRTFSGSQLVQGLQYYFMKKEDITNAALNIEPFIEEKVDKILKDLKVSSR